MTSILVTHEMAFAREIAHHVYFTDHGVIVEDGPPRSSSAARKRSARARFWSRSSDETHVQVAVIGGGVVGA